MQIRFIEINLFKEYLDDVQYNVCIVYRAVHSRTVIMYVLKNNLYMHVCVRVCMHMCAPALLLTKTGWYVVFRLAVSFSIHDT